jgi:hypothetical protein
MASQINPNNIDITYPIAGQDNDTKGFRDNFSSIRSNFITAKTEITGLQNYFVSNVLQLTSMTTSDRNVLTPANGMLIYNSTFNQFQGYANGTWGNISLS